MPEPVRETVSPAVKILRRSREVATHQRGAPAGLIVLAGRGSARRIRVRRVETSANSVPSLRKEALTRRSSPRDRTKYNS